MSTLKVVSSKLAAEIDKELMGPSVGFTLQQLMELAGLSVAEVINREFPLKSGEKKNVFILAGPGNNGGDGLVCARHLKLFGYNPIVYYPKRSEKVEFYKQLLNQLNFFKVPVLGPENNDNWLEYLKPDKTVCIVDALFGFSFKAPLRETFATIIKEVSNLQDKVPVVAVDVPSGWNVDDGPISEPHIIPKILVSLTVPKPCSQFLPKNSVQYVGGRFIAPEFARKYGFEPFEYQSCDQILKL